MGARKLSILIVTYRRAGLLKRCLRSLLEAAQAHPELPVELVVDINGSDPETSSELGLFSRVAASLGIAFHGREQEQALSPSGARNRALSRAQGDWVFFADDDIYVPQTLFRDFSRLLKEFPGSIALGGPNLTPPESNLFQQASGFALASGFATWQSAPRYRAQGQARGCGEESLILCNLFVRRDVLGDEPFRDSLKCGEENWLIRKLSSRGQGVVYAPELLVWHERRKTVLGFARQIFWYGFGRGQNLRLSFQESGKVRNAASSVRFFLPSLCVLYTLLLLGAALSGKDIRPHALPFLLYGALCGLAALWGAGSGGESKTARAASALLFPVIHSFYGVGLLFGLARRS